MTEIILTNSSARLVEPHPAVEAFVRRHLTFEVSTFILVHSRFGRKPQHKIEKVCVYDKRTGKFPAGYLSGVLREIRLHAQEADTTQEEKDAIGALTVSDKRVKPCAPDMTVDISWTQSKDPDYSFQFDAVQAVLKRTRGIIQIPTGGGKTNVAVALVELLHKAKGALLIVHTSKLMHQAAERYKKLTGQEAGLIGDGRWKQEHFTCATFQTLYKALKKKDPRLDALLASTDILIIDECHALAADSFSLVAEAFKNAYYRFGISATPMARGDKRSIHTVGLLGSIIYKITPAELVTRGVISLPDIVFVKKTQIPTSKTWQGMYSECIVDSASRNEILVKVAQKVEKPALLFVKEIAHGKDLMKRLKRSGVTTEFVWGAKETGVRDACIRRLEHGDTDVLISSVVFQEGVDIPELRSVIVACAGKSTIAAIQRVGRGSRIVRDANGKTIKSSFQVWDVEDRGHRILERWSAERKRAYKREGYPVRYEKVGG